MNFKSLENYFLIWMSMLFFNAYKPEMAQAVSFLWEI